MAGERVPVQGLAELKAKFAEIPRAMRRRVLRTGLAAGARQVRDAAKRSAPVLSLRSSLKAPYRKPGTVRKAIAVRNSKSARRQGDVGVFVNVRPAKTGQRGAKNPNDPFYWRFINFGTRWVRGARFMESGARRLGDALQVFERHVATWLRGINNGKEIK